MDASNVQLYGYVVACACFVALLPHFLNQARAGLRPAHAWFLRIAFCPRMYACVSAPEAINN